MSELTETPSHSDSEHESSEAPQLEGAVGELYVLCPWGGVTGGPEALHQLVHVARRLGARAYIVYTQPEGDKVTPAYTSYDVEIAPEVDNRPGNVVVVPEIWPDLLGAYARATRVLWWLSWDHGKNRLDESSDPDVVYAFQSRYAAREAQQAGVCQRRTYMLSDFISEEFRRPTESTTGKAARVAYFPVKGGEFVDQLREAAPDIDFIALEGMSESGVREALLHSKVYVDFGPHPGKDRVPREAATCGCCVITASDRGAAAVLEDVPIPREYKLRTSPFNRDGAALLVRGCLAEYEARIKHFSHYRCAIEAEPFLFEEQVHLMLSELGCLPPTS